MEEVDFQKIADALEIEQLKIWVDNLKKPLCFVGRVAPKQKGSTVELYHTTCESGACHFKLVLPKAKAWKFDMLPSSVQ